MIDFDKIGLGQEYNYKELIKTIHLLSGLTVSLFDAKGFHIASCPLDHCSFCSLIRRKREVMDICAKSDVEAFAKCNLKDNSRKVHFYQCPMGLYEVITPIYHHGILMGYIMMGQGMKKTPEQREQTFNLARPFADSDEALNAAIDTMPQLTEEEMVAAIRMLEIFSDYISFNNLLPIPNNGLAYSVRQYINKNYANRFSNADLCRAFHCSNKTLTKAFRVAYKKTIVEYTNDLRLEQAKYLFKHNPDLSVSAVASACGFADQGYFCKLFLKKYGITSTQMRQKYKDINFNARPN